jgi:hypothetical protein
MQWLQGEVGSQNFFASRTLATLLLRIWSSSKDLDKVRTKAKRESKTEKKKKK